MPGEMLAHPCPLEPRVDATGTGAEEKGHVQHVTTGARWPLQGDGLVLKHSKTPAKCAPDQRDPGKEPFRGCTEHSFGPKLCCDLGTEHPSPAASSSSTHPCSSTHTLQGQDPGAVHPPLLQDSARGIWECHNTHSHPKPTASPATPCTLKSSLGKHRLFIHPPTSTYPDSRTGGKEEDKGAAGLGRDHLHQGLPKDTPKPQDMPPHCSAHMTPTQTSGVPPYPFPPLPPFPCRPPQPPRCPSSEDGC